MPILTKFSLDISALTLLVPNSKNIEINNKNIFTVSGSVILFDGWRKVYSDDEEEQDEPDDEKESKDAESDKKEKEKDEKKPKEKKPKKK